MKLAEDNLEHQAEDLPDPPRRLEPAATGDRSLAAGGSGTGPDDAGRVVDALKSSSDQELTIAERLASKARQAFALGAGVFVVAQTVAFGSFNASKLSGHEQHWGIGLAIAAVVALGLAGISTLKADAPEPSGDLPLAKLEDDLNAAYDGDPEVLGRLGGYYLGVVRSRRDANKCRRTSYVWARRFVVISMLTTVAELIYALLART